MSRTITHEDAQNAIDHFNFEQEARDYCNSDRFAKKHGVVKPISSYNELSEVPEHLALAAMQHAACQKQALLFQKLGVKYNITIFEVLSKDNSNDTDSQSSSNGAATTTSSSHGSSDTITEAEATVDSVRHVTQINIKLSKLHHKADSLINYPSQGVADAMENIFKRIGELKTMSKTDKVPKRVYNNVQRECLQVVIKLLSHLTKLAINTTCSGTVKNIIKDEQTFISSKNKKWEAFAEDYQDLINTTGAKDVLIKKDMARFAATKKTDAANNAPSIHSNPGYHGLLD